MQPAFIGRWLRSYEERVEGARVYRPEGTPLPPARGRAALEIRADGTFVDARIGPIEGSPPSLGRWRSPDGRRGMVAVPGEPELTFELEELDDGSKRILLRRG